jgi:Domain of unknown function (DUF4160)
MPTILRFRGLRVMIYTHDHWPPHVHVIAPEAQAKIALGEARQRPQVLINDGLTPRQLNWALTEIDRNRELLLTRWREIYGDA